MKIVHLTTVHPRDDVRIALKEAATLEVAWPHDVCLVVADGLGHDRSASPMVYDLGGNGSSRISRFLRGSARALRYLWRNPPAIVHFHDPELIPVAVLLKLRGIKVIYDAHENIALQILSKHYLPLIVRRVVAPVAGLMETLSASLFDAVVAATPSIARRFAERKTIIIQNFPIMDEFEEILAPSFEQRGKQFVYVGVISDARGACELVDAIALLDDQEVELTLAGRVVPKELMDRIAVKPGWKRTAYLGVLGRPDIASLLCNARAGLVTLHPAPNHIEAFPIKMFEYMAAGLPIIASDFPLWREIMERAECGYLVDPKDPYAIASAMEQILDDATQAEEMGKRGRQSALELYNWQREAEKLINLYEAMLGIRSSFSC